MCSMTLVCALEVFVVREVMFKFVPNTAVAYVWLLIQKTRNSRGDRERSRCERHYGERSMNKMQREMEFTYRTAMTTKIR